MVSIDDRPHEMLGTGSGGAWWRRPRWLVLPVALPLFLVFGLAVGILMNLALGEGMGQAGAGLLGSGRAAAAEAGDTALAGAPAGVCERMQYIVDTACALKQRDHDAWGIRQCVAHELKYTMWSAYGCN
jgi:hypothetical protein